MTKVAEADRSFDGRITPDVGETSVMRDSLRSERFVSDEGSWPLSRRLDMGRLAEANEQWRRVCHTDATIGRSLTASFYL